ncbi:CheB methylesterase [Lysobacter sp. yr284]|uniref:chemotaxis protein CheB n=1 Tax=Lysobacter sp. yr284 TaxID=1761791 RepID=UPI0008982133|nr:chemotaxis protein CheB [Lysobacter sp. yr284]SDZ04006.1 CheB methylesterase [Lysobacter sp. yr284]
MADGDRRVVLLARAGVACERLRNALVEAGAQLVLEGDPTVLDPKALDAADPDVVVVVLDPAAEDALDRFENVLVDPSIEVIFEEAELAAAREGWDAARWARHLTAKLHRHDDVLPPGREPEQPPAPALQAEGFQRPVQEGSPLAQEPADVPAPVASDNVLAFVRPGAAAALAAAELAPASAEVSVAAPSPQGEDAAAAEYTLDFAETAPQAEYIGFDEGAARVTFDAVEPAPQVDPDAAGLDSIGLDSSALDSAEFESTELESADLDSTRLDSLDFESAGFQSPASEPPRHTADRFDSADFGEIEEIEAVEALPAFDPDDEPPPALAAHVSFDPVSAESPVDPLSFGGESLGELDRVAPIGSAGDRVLTEPPPLPDEAREFFARQALGPSDESAGADAPAASHDGGDVTFDFSNLTLEAGDYSTQVPGQAQPFDAQHHDWQAEGADAGVPPLDEAGLGEMEMWRAPAPGQVQELVDLDAAFAAHGDDAGAALDFDDSRAPPPQAATPARSFETTLEFASDETAPAQPKGPAPSAPSVPDWSFADETSLVEAATGQSGAHAPPGPRHDLEEIERRISGLELVDDSPADAGAVANGGRGGAVLVLAGIGGPDAVRQLLGALPDNFDRPVLVQQRLDGGRYDKLVAQMQRATPVLVKLAEAGARTIAGVIYILPAGIGIEVSDNGIQFAEGGEVLEALPAGDSAVLLFSGAEPAQVDAAMALAAQGAMVVGQAPDGCYDAAAASAAIARGAGSGQPAELAARLAARWSRL